MIRCDEKVLMNGDTVQCEMESGHQGAHRGDYRSWVPFMWLDSGQYAIIDAERDARDLARVEARLARKARPLWRRLLRP